MRVLVTGGTGLIGSALCTSLLRDGHGVIILSRRPEAAQARRGDGVEVVRWSGGEQLPAAALQDVQAVVNLAGENIGAGRWTVARKERIIASRREVTRNLVLSIAGSGERPRVLVNASAVGYYGPRGDEEVTEEDAPGDDFLARVCRAWEEEARRAEDLGLRVVTLRFGLVLARQGGSLPRLVRPFRLFLGGPLGSGRQWVSWVHLADALGLVRLALEEEGLAGPLNVTAPQPVRMEELARILGRVLGRPCSLRLPAGVLRLALGEMAEMLLTGQRVLPERALRASYSFRYPGLEAALRDLLAAAANKR
ncbi:MAG: TIGR01777 family protein [Clostridia bacterium]|nr:MAG: TIGR01777 family protein [Clostridia bacterium]